MDHLKKSFEDVADWCEKHLEAQRGREIGMTFGAMLRAYGRLTRLPAGLNGEMRLQTQRELNAKAEALLRELSKRVVVAAGNFKTEGDVRRIKPLAPSSLRTNMIYDPGPRPKE